MREFVNWREISDISNRDHLNIWPHGDVCMFRNWNSNVSFASIYSEFSMKLHQEGANNIVPILVRVMGWCHQGTSDYLSKCWPRSTLPYGFIRSQWAKEFMFCFTAMAHTYYIGSRRQRYWTFKTFVQQPPLLTPSGAWRLSHTVVAVFCSAHSHSFAVLEPSLGSNENCQCVVIA